MSEINPALEQQEISQVNNEKFKTQNPKSTFILLNLPKPKTNNFPYRTERANFIN